MERYYLRLLRNRTTAAITTTTPINPIRMCIVGGSSGGGVGEGGGDAVGVGDGEAVGVEVGVGEVVGDVV